MKPTSFSRKTIVKQLFADYVLVKKPKKWGDFAVGNGTIVAIISFKPWSRP